MDCSDVPPPDASGYRNESIRQAVLGLLNSTVPYLRLFGALYPSVASGGLIDFTMFGRAIAEFEFTMVFANAPLDRYSRGDTNALSRDEKLGALIFFGKGKCISCHAVTGQSNEMFSDFQMHNIGVPMIAPFFGVEQGDVIFDGPSQDEDYGLEEISGNSADRYKFRSSPLRNAALQPAFFHNGAFTRLEDAVQHHLNVSESAGHYNAVRAGVDTDLTHRLGPIERVLATVDPLLASPIELRQDEFAQLVSFVRNGLLDQRAAAKSLCRLVPASVPSGMPVLTFEGCETPGDDINDRGQR